MPRWPFVSPTTLSSALVCAIKPRAARGFPKRRPRCTRTSAPLLADLRHYATVFLCESVRNGRWLHCQLALGLNAQQSRAETPPEDDDAGWALWLEPARRRTDTCNGLPLRFPVFLKASLISGLPKPLLARRQRGTASSCPPRAVISCKQTAASTGSRTRRQLAWTLSFCARRATNGFWIGAAFFTVLRALLLRPLLTCSGASPIRPLCGADSPILSTSLPPPSS